MTINSKNLDQLKMVKDAEVILNRLATKLSGPDELDIRVIQKDTFKVRQILNDINNKIIMDLMRKD